MFADVLQALRAAAREAGLQESPQAQESKQGFSRRHRGYRVVMGEIPNTGKYTDRSWAKLKYNLQLLVTHRLRPTPEDGFADLATAGEDYESLVRALMGDGPLNGLGDLQVAGISPKMDPTGEWMEAKLSLSIEVEVSWLLDGGEETGS